jgi:uncharacterized membrane protein YeiH
MRAIRHSLFLSPLIRVPRFTEAAAKRRMSSINANHQSIKVVAPNPVVAPVRHVDSMARYPDFTAGGILRGMHYAGTVLYASSGAVIAASTGMDLLGTVAVGTITACGGGTIRDVFILRQVPFWANGEIEYLWISAVAAFATFFLYPEFEDSWPNDERADIVFQGAFSCIGTMFAIRAGVSAPLCVLCAVMTGTGGGATRDVLTRRPVRIMHANKGKYFTLLYFTLLYFNCYAMLCYFIL